ncbi:MAG: alpha/beta hydrolase [Polyangiales bacterium]
MASILAELAKLYSRAVIKRRPHDVPTLVRHLRRTMDRPPFPAILSRGVSLRRTRIAGIPCDLVTTEQPKTAVLYLHGGGYVAGVTETYHPFAAELAKGLVAEVFLPVYRLAPEHPFPAAHEDAMATYEAILAKGYRGEDIVVAGDSAGGGLTLAVLLAIRDRGLPRPRCALAMSPYADVTATLPSVDLNDRSDSMLSAYLLRLGGDVYHGRTDARDPYVSPIYGDFHGLPPLYVTVSNEECLLDDALSVVSKAREAGVHVELVRRSGLLHVWPVFVPFVPEAREDVRKMIAFARGAAVRAPGVSSAPRGSARSAAG